MVISREEKQQQKNEAERPAENKETKRADLFAIGQPGQRALIEKLGAEFFPGLSRAEAERVQEFETFLLAPGARPISPNVNHARSGKGEVQPCQDVVKC